MKCQKCGLKLRRIMLLALLIDAGAEVSPGLQCAAGGEHEWDETAYPHEPEVFTMDEYRRNNSE